MGCIVIPGGRSPHPAFEVALRPAKLDGHTVLLSEERVVDGETIELWREYPLVLLPEDLRAATEAGLFDNLDVHIDHFDFWQGGYAAASKGGVTGSFAWDDSNQQAVGTLYPSGLAANQVAAIGQEAEVARQSGTPLARYGLSPVVGLNYGDLLQSPHPFAGHVPVTITDVMALDIVDREALTGSTFLRQLSSGRTGEQRLPQYIPMNAFLSKELTAMSVSVQQPAPPEQGGQLPPEAAPQDATLAALTAQVNQLVAAVTGLQARVEQQAGDSEQIISAVTELASVVTAVRQQALSSAPVQAAPRQQAMSLLDEAIRQLQSGAALPGTQQAPPLEMQPEQMIGGLLKALEAERTQQHQTALARSADEARQRMLAEGQPESVTDNVLSAMTALGINPV